MSQPTTLAILLDGVPVSSTIEIPSDGITFEELTITTTPPRPGATFDVRTRSSFKIKPVHATLDESGQATVILGPTRDCGDSGGTIFLDGATPVSFGVRFR